VSRRGRNTLLGCGLVLLLLLGACSTDRAATGAPLHAFTDALDDEVPRLMKRFGVPGVAIAIIRDGEPAWSGAYGLADRETDVPMTVDTVCRAESISKSVTAWGIMKLVEQGEIDLDAPIASYLPGWALPGSLHDEHAITVEHLLSHRSGLPLGTIGPPSEYAPGAPRPTVSQFVQADAVLIQEPGESFLYSDVGFNTLELVMDAVGGQEFVDYMEREVLVPLGMTDSSYAWRSSYETDLANGYEMDGTPVPPYVYPAHASGGLFVTVDDVALFVAASVGSATVPGTRVLSDAGRREMYRPRATIPGLYGFVADAYGLGHFVEELPDGRTAVWHGGQGHGWMTHFHAVPESGEGIVVLTNSQRSWPLIASILPRWASWSGIGTVRFGVITPATRVFWAVIAAVGLVTIWLAYRLLDGVFRGNRLWAPFSGVRPVARLAQGIAGVTVLATVLWRISLPYVDEASIFPTAVPWAAVALIALGSVLVVGAAVPRRGARDAAPPP
jgi:CubicO group peptidase (beta-lactamase class C family)